MKTFKNIQNKPVVVDGKYCFISRSVACLCVLILENDKGTFVLINKRGSGAMDSPHKWNLPAGYLDWNENGIECATREIWEECGVDLDALLESNVVLYKSTEPFKILTEPEENGRQNVVLCYGVMIKSENSYFPIVTNQNCEKDEVEEILWCPIYHLINYDFAFNHDQRIVDFLKFIKK
jgi:8-oxo-dGTP pyrophosphatase MutT (NUDIX family)